MSEGNLLHGERNPSAKVFRVLEKGLTIELDPPGYQGLRLPGVDPFPFSQHYAGCGVGWYVWRPGGGVDGEEHVG